MKYFYVFIILVFGGLAIGMSIEQKYVDALGAYLVTYDYEAGMYNFENAINQILGVVFIVVMFFGILMPIMRVEKTDESEKQMTGE